MSQTRTQSAIESAMNILVGYGINMAANFLIFPLFGWHISLSQNLILGVIYTLISFARSYALRRFYNWRHQSPVEPEPRYRQRYCPHDSFGVRRIYDRETGAYIDSDAITPELLARWHGRREKISQHMNNKGEN